MKKRDVVRRILEKTVTIKARLKIRLWSFLIKKKFHLFSIKKPVFFLRLMTKKQVEKDRITC